MLYGGSITKIWSTSIWRFKEFFQQGYFFSDVFCIVYGPILKEKFQIFQYKSYYLGSYSSKDNVRSTILLKIQIWISKSYNISLSSNDKAVYSRICFSKYQGSSKKVYKCAILFFWIALSGVWTCENVDKTLPCFRSDPL